MDVSNSTGQNTGYRVVGAGGNMCAHRENDPQVREVWLKPGQTEKCQFSLPSGSFRVTFLSDAGEEVASATFHKDPGMVSLCGDEWGFRIIQPENGSACEIRV